MLFNRLGNFARLIGNSELIPNDALTNSNSNKKEMQWYSVSTKKVTPLSFEPKTCSMWFWCSNCYTVPQMAVTNLWESLILVLVQRAWQNQIIALYIVKHVSSKYISGFWTFFTKRPDPIDKSLSTNFAWKNSYYQVIEKSFIHL